MYLGGGGGGGGGGGPFLEATLPVHLLHTYNYMPMGSSTKTNCFYASIIISVQSFLTSTNKVVMNRFCVVDMEQAELLPTASS